MNTGDSAIEAPRSKKDALWHTTSLISSRRSPGEGLKLTGLFSAERVKRAARTGRNPRTGEIIEIPATYGVRISAGSLLKKAVTE